MPGSLLLNGSIAEGARFAPLRGIDIRKMLSKQRYVSGALSNRRRVYFQHIQKVVGFAKLNPPTMAASRLIWVAANHANVNADWLASAHAFYLPFPERKSAAY